MKALGFNQLKVYPFQSLVSDVNLHPYTMGGSSAAAATAVAATAVAATGGRAGGSNGGGAGAVNGASQAQSAPGDAVKVGRCKLTLAGLKATAFNRFQTLIVKRITLLSI